MKEIELTKGFKAIVDDEDFKELNKHKWHSQKKGNNKNSKDYVYAQNRTLGPMHRYIIKAKKGMIVDHINGNTLDNRKSNLRGCTISQNALNCKKYKRKNSTSKYKGISKNYKKWNVLITIDGKSKNIGRFENELDAAKFWDKKMIEIYGEYAKLNFPKDKS